MTTRGKGTKIRKKIQPSAAASPWTLSPLFQFLNGVHDRILGTFTGSRGASAATKGSVREAAIAEIGLSLPSVAQLYRGDIIDAHGSHTGQLDGIVVHANSPAVALSGSDRIVLAEGAVGVIEVKSNLQSQWSEVLGTWDKLKRIRRPIPRLGHLAKALKPFGKPENEKIATLWIHEQAVSFFVVGWKGWASREKLEAKVRELHAAFGTGPRPLIFVGQLDPPGFGVMWPTGENVETTPDGSTLYEYSVQAWIAGEGEHDARGVVLLNIWKMLTERVRNASLIDIDWDRYLSTSLPETVKQASLQSHVTTPKGNDST